MSLPLGSVLTAGPIFRVNGVPTTPSSPPTITAAYYGDNTLLSPLPSVGAPISPGVYSVNVFTALQTASITGTYSVIFYTTDATVSQQEIEWAWQDVGVNSVSAFTTAAITAVQAGLATLANQTTILARLGSITGSGVNTVLGFFKVLLSKSATLPSDIGGTFTPTTDSTEAIAEAIAAEGGDPWATDLEAGGYSAGEAGAIVLAIQTQTGLIGTTAVTMNAPQFNSMNYPLVAGRAYKQEFGNALQFVLANTSIDLTDPDISFSLNLKPNGTPTAFVGTALTSQTGFFEVDADETADWVTTANTDGLRVYGDIVVYSGVDPDPITPIDVTVGWLKVVPGVNNA